MEKYYEMFRDKNQANKKDVFNSPDSPDTRTRTRTRDMGELDLGEVGGWVRRSEVCVRERNQSHLLRLHSLSFIKISC
jgi:hypothetical protein